MTTPNVNVNVNIHDDDDAELAKAWAIKTDGPVECDEYSAKYHAQSAAADRDAVEKARDEILAATGGRKPGEPNGLATLDENGKVPLEQLPGGSSSDIDATAILTKLKTVDGADSGLDADLLDGRNAADIVDEAVAKVTNGAPGALDTLNELAQALGDDADFAATVTNTLAGKAPLDHTHSWESITGKPEINGAVSLQGPTIIPSDSPSTWAITDYSSFAEYAVSASHGTASITGDSVTWLPAEATTAATQTLTITKDGIPHAFTVSVTDAIHNPNIIGVANLDVNVTGGTWAYIDKNGEPVTPTTDYFNTHPVWSGIQDVAIEGQAMVKIPKFYVKRAAISGGQYDGKEAWWISDKPAAGFHIHPAFRDAGEDIDQVYIGKYQANYNVSKLVSTPGVMPSTGYSLTEVQLAAKEHNTSGITGFMLWSVYHLAAVQWLYLVENATMDSQTKTGMGKVGEGTRPDDVDAAEVAEATYRGIVGLWGNVLQWIDGLKTVACKVHIWDNDGKQEWINTEQSPEILNNYMYPLTFLENEGSGYNLADVFVGKTGATTSSNANTPDHQYWYGDSSGFPQDGFPLAGGTLGWLKNAGLWGIQGAKSASVKYNYYGSRLAKI